MSILDGVKKILTYKLMQARGYEKLANKTKDERAKRFLLEISEHEKRDYQFLAEEIQKPKIESEKPPRFLDIRIDLMMRILGSRGFLEWTVVAEDEAVEDLAMEASTLEDPVESEKWTRIAADEHLHIVRRKEDVLGMESWEMGGGGGVADVIFGANDGLVSILALVAGVYGAVTESHLIFIAGVAGAVAGAISMGAGSYLSSKSEQEVTQKENQRKEPTGGTPEKKMEELVDLYQSRGLSREEAEEVAKRIVVQLETKEEQTIPDEVGLTSEESWPPIKAAALTGSSFAVVSLIPILPFAFIENVTVAIFTAAIASIVCLFGVGASKAIFTRKSWIRSGLEMMAIGTLAALATYVIGLAIPE
jgi:VIT1/CCC1 family predicted Fe2+/Mn2+ transporter